MTIYDNCFDWWKIEKTMASALSCLLSQGILVKSNCCCQHLFYTEAWVNQVVGILSRNRRPATKVKFKSFLFIRHCCMAKSVLSINFSTFSRIKTHFTQTISRRERIADNTCWNAIFSQLAMMSRDWLGKVSDRHGVLTEQSKKIDQPQGKQWVLLPRDLQTPNVEVEGK